MVMRYLTCITLLILSTSAFTDVKDVMPDTCQTPRDCISKIYKVLDRSRWPGQYPSLEEQAIIKKLLDLGEDAMPFVVQLLEEDDELIASIGAVALSEAKTIDEKYLPQIIKGLERDVSWLAPALAKIGTPEAAEIAVKIFLVSDSSPHNQEAYALKLLGKKAFPAIIKAAKCELGCNKKTYYLLGSVLGEMEESRSDAAISLIDLVENSSLSVEIRQGVLYMIGFLDKPGLVVEDKILMIRDHETQLTDAANRALIGIKSKHSGEIYLEILANGVDGNLLRDVAALGTSGNDAGAAIIDLLDSNAMEERLLAARTLGYIEYAQAAPKLIQLLNEQSDVQLNWVAAESLGRMKSEIAIPALINTSESHWYPPVRDAAKKAIEHVNTGEAYESDFSESNFAFDYFNYEHFGMNPCEEISLKAKPEPKYQKLYRSTAKEKLESLAYQSVIVSYGASDEEQQKAEDPDGIIEVNEQNIVEHRQEIKQVPNIALRVNGGWLAGGNRGEWGGELVFIPDNGKATKILDENIENIYKHGDRYIAITGLAHMSMNDGMIYELLQTKDGNWQTNEWLKLPGSPASSRLVETGEILINTIGGGSILLSDNGSLRMATCK